MPLEVKGGYIRYFGLEDFWNTLTDEQKEACIPADGSFWMSTREDILEKQLSYSLASAPSFLMNIVGVFAWRKEYDLVDAIYFLAEKMCESAFTMHFVHIHAIKTYYKLRNIRNYLETCIDYCKKDIALFPTYADALVRELKIMPRIPSFCRLAIILEKQGDYSGAMAVCEQAVSYGLFDDGTKGGMNGRMERLKRKMSELVPTP